MTMLRHIMKTGQDQPADGRRWNTTGSGPTVAKNPTHAELAENINRKTRQFAAYARKRGKLNYNGWQIGVKRQHHNAYNRAGQKQAWLKRQLKEPKPKNK